MINTFKNFKRNRKRSTNYH